MEVYVVGNGRAPSWIRGVFEPFQAYDGSVGYQLTVGGLSWALHKGDKIYRRAGGILVDVERDGFWRRW